MEERLERLMELYRHALLGGHLGMRLHFEDGRAVVNLPWADYLAHGMGGVHGGIFGTLIDTAAWFTAAAHYDAWISTIEYHTRLLEPVEGEDLVATGTLVRAGKRLAVATAEVHTAAGRLAATGTGSFTVTGIRIEDAVG